MIYLHYFIDYYHIKMDFFKFILCCLSLFFYTYSFAAEFSPPFLDEPRFELLTAIPQVEVNKIFQDKKGFLWFGTNQGLLKFDSYRVKSYLASNKENSLSSNLVWDIVDDDKGHLWLSTYGGGLNQFIPEEERFVTFKSGDDNDELASDTLWDIEKFGSQHLWIGSRNWLNRFNTSNHKNSRFSPDSPSPLNINNNVWSLFTDNEENLWIGTLGGGLYRFSPTSGELKQYQHNEKNAGSLSHNLVRAITQDSQGNIWVATDNGLNVLNKQADSFKRYYHVQGNKQSLSSNEISKLYTDSSHRLWIGTYGSGVNLYHPQTNSFQRYNFRSLGLAKSKTPNIINDIFEDGQGNIWFATDKGVIKLHPDAASISHMIFEDNMLSDITSMLYSSNSGLWAAFYNKLLNFNKDNFNYQIVTALPSIISDISEAPSGNLWVSTKDHGIYKISPKGEILVHVNNNETSPSLPNNYVYSLYAQSDQRLWLGFALTDKPGGLALFEEGKGITHHFFKNRVIKDIEKLDNDTLLLATNLSGVIKFNTKTLEHSYINNVEEKTLNNINELYIAANQKIWLGTDAGLAELSLKERKIIPYTPELGIIYGIHSDENTGLWLTTNNKLFHYDVNTRSYEEYGEGKGLSVAKFTQRTLLKASDKLILGSNDGFFYFTPNLTDNPGLARKVQLTEFKLFNKIVPLSNAQLPTPLNKPLSLLDKVTLTHEDYLFSFSFSALDFNAPDNIQYQYLLAGFDKQWISTDATDRIATYSAIPPGDYIFKVKATTNAQVTPETSIRLTILPPWWKTTYAYTSYVILMLALLYLLVSLRTRVLKQQAKTLEQGIKTRTLALEQQTQTIARLLEQKKNMFTNVSHELRTPLTLILSPVEQLLSREQSSQNKSLLSLIKQNSQRLLMMVEQLLELAWLESPDKKEKALFSLTEHLPLIIASYKPLAAAKNQQLSTREIDDVKLLLYPDSLDKIIGNILSNAIKYTPEGGSIEVTTAVQKGKVIISVIDNGLGIADKHQAIIFERFQRGSYKNNEQIAGAGIGLAIVKELVALHQGSIMLDSQEHNGCQFHVSLPIFIGTQGDIVSAGERPIAKQQNLVAFPVENNQPQVSDAETNLKHPIMLIVEDNVDMAAYLVSIFNREYHCILASDGQAGLAKAIEHVPDVIVSDVMMPVIDGYQLCQKIKQNDLLAHIPILLLTAKADLESKLTGLRLHSDDYLTKPFSDEELTLRVNNLLNARNRLRQQIAKELQDDPGAIVQISKVLNSKDQNFIHAFERLVIKRYPETEFGLASAAYQLNMSDRQLQRKLNALMDNNFSEYLRLFRLHKASELLQDGLTSTLVSEQVGFSSPSYFSTCFKSHFKETPKQFQQRQLTLQRKTAIQNE
ncbi:hybrid sensor histidine kinase/response regulator transcription factor [Thalassomonas sp. RHCl1]|uniref:hybrid sensor histidine kinase/response regulator transcription factor n=1 Tax=Thalassomonas sp. RHCl1 TaxID=2995320 RepID=UPI00248B7BDD|nr:hybrid sensor histidine kinase/response regulator transcription factor [Thalassomonas sp. RHCl1]